MATSLATPSMATIILLLLLLIPTGSTLNHTASSAFCGASHPKKCHLVEDEVANSEFMMESGISYYNKFKSGGTSNPNKPSVPPCGRPPRYDSCLNQKRQTPPGEKCDTYKRTPC